METTPTADAGPLIRMRAASLWTCSRAVDGDSNDLACGSDSPPGGKSTDSDRTMRAAERLGGPQPTVASNAQAGRPMVLAPGVRRRHVLHDRSIAPHTDRASAT